MIKSFGCKQTEQLFRRQRPRRLPADIHEVARRKLVMLDAANAVDALRVPPGNRLEQLKGNLAGQWSIRINDQWRICFIWQDGNAYDVRIVDYH
jgi:proteic killer suppression protein